MAEITSLEQCFSVAGVLKYITNLNEINERLNNDVVKVADENLFGKKVFYCGNSHVTVKEKVKKVNDKVKSTESEIKKLINLLQKKAYEQRIEDLGKYIDYLNTEIANCQSAIQKYQSLLETNYSKKGPDSQGGKIDYIKDESDFGVQNRMNAIRITEWRSIMIGREDKYSDLDILQEKLAKAKSELTNAKIMVMHNFI